MEDITQAMDKWNAFHSEEPGCVDPSIPRNSEL